MSRFKVAVSSQFGELWRYNIVVVCELCSANGERIEYKSAESIVAPVGSNLDSAPTGYSVDRALNIESGEGDNINLLVYVVPHTLPSVDDISMTNPFPLVVKVEREGEQILSRTFDINQWSGDNIALERVGGIAKSER